MDDPDMIEQVEDAMRVTGVAGASLGILVGDRSEIAVAGWADAEARILVEPTTRFQISSVTKPMVATVIARLAERGALAYDDPVGAHVPEVVDAPWARKVLIHHLLSQTHAIAAPPHLELDFEHDGDDALAALAAQLATCSTMSPPGEVWSYSNCGANLLGRAIETVCGSTWEEAMRTELLEPLGMGATGFVHEGVAASVLGGYVAAGAWEDREVAPDPPTWELAEPWTARPLGPGGTTVWSTVGDLLLFARLHLADGALPDGNRYCAPGSLARLRETTVAVRVPDFLDGWCSMMARWDWREATAFGWDGVATGYRSVWSIVPSRDVAVVVLANTSTGRRFFRRILPRVLAPMGLTPQPYELTPRPGAAGDLHRFAGTYACGEERIEVVVDGNALAWSLPDGREMHGQPIDDHVFLSDPTDPDFPTTAFGSFDADGRPRMLYPDPWGFHRIERDPVRTP